MLNRKNKKGFTLAELLIVVAIIAVLVAIAVPLFVGALKEAEEQVKAANIRSVKGAAVASILLNDKNIETEKTNGWVATACVTSNGDVEHLAIKTGSGGTSKVDTCKPHEGADGCGDGTDAGCGKEGDGGCTCKYRVTVYISALDLVNVG